MMTTAAQPRTASVDRANGCFQTALDLSIRIEFTYATLPDHHAHVMCRRHGLRLSKLQAVAARSAAGVRRIARALAGRRDEDLLHAAWLPRGTGSQRTDDRGAHPHRLGCGRSHV